VVNDHDAGGASRRSDWLKMETIKVSSVWFTINLYCGAVVGSQFEAVKSSMAAPMQAKQ
jgi:hypothetical protein